MHSDGISALFNGILNENMKNRVQGDVQDTHKREWMNLVMKIRSYLKTYQTLKMSFLIKNSKTVGLVLNLCELAVL